MVQIVAEAEGTVVLKSRTIVSVLDLFGIHSYIPSLIGIFDAVAPEGIMEKMPKCLWPRLGPGCFLFTAASQRFWDYVLPRRQTHNIVPITLQVPWVQSWLGIFHVVSCFFSSSSGLLFDIVAARAIALLVRGALWEGKLIHLSRLLFHAEQRHCMWGQKWRRHELAVLLHLYHVTRGATIFTPGINIKATCI